MLARQEGACIDDHYLGFRVYDVPLHLFLDGFHPKCSSICRRNPGSTVWNHLRLLHVLDDGRLDLVQLCQRDSGTFQSFVHAQALRESDADHWATMDLDIQGTCP